MRNNSSDEAAASPANARPHIPKVVLTVLSLATAILLVVVLVQDWNIVRRNSHIELSPAHAKDLIVGETRPADAMTYGEFARRKMSGLLCLPDVASNFRYVVSEAGLNRDPTFTVTMVYQGAATPQCYSELGRRAVIGVMTASEGVNRPNAPPRNEWLRDFREGRDANS